ncbi:hypothetical protein B0H12DRAFT_1152896 [Mycena haematopus]|nr:hypothetical protein B0H12DRAFT_1152896 [Mycena haematopus]
MRECREGCIASLQKMFKASSQNFLQLSSATHYRRSQFYAGPMLLLFRLWARDLRIQHQQFQIHQRCSQAVVVHYWPHPRPLLTALSHCLAVHLRCTVTTCRLTTVAVCPRFVWAVRLRPHVSGSAKPSS